MVMIDVATMDLALLNGAMMDGGMSSHGRFASPVGVGLRALIQIMSGPDGLAGVAFFGDANHLIRI